MLHFCLHTTPKAWLRWGMHYNQGNTIYYAGDGKFSYEMDLMNMGHINQDLRAAQWTPSGAFNMPPKSPNRDYSRR